MVCSFQVLRNGERASSVCNCFCFNLRETCGIRPASCVSLSAFFSLVSVSCVRVFRVEQCGLADAAERRSRPVPAGPRHPLANVLIFCCKTLCAGFLFFLAGEWFRLISRFSPPAGKVCRFSHLKNCSRPYYPLHAL